ncbi:TPA: morphogenetic protein [Klebsiella variicola subsp. variicola]|nr:morphogenetic protein [Klebsiella variicola subsp. variicola]HCM5370152.1 morphogenetic protein [Klebsiella variicola subsp. variicola]
MTERGMIFNGEMVRAILDGRKTQTRRIMKVQPESNQLGLLLITDSTRHSDIGKYHWAESNATGNHVRSKLFSCPFGAVGDRIWVRETFQGPLVHEELFEEYSAYPEKFETPEYCEYAADGGVRPEYCDLDDNLRHGWRPSIHMPRWASRILLEITNVRVERLDAISEEDALAEGMQGVICPCCKGDSEYSTSQYDAETLAVIDEIPCRACESNRSKFFTLWDSIYGYGQHCFGEWVWVIEFKRVEGGAA